MTVLLTLTSDNSANFDRILQKHTSFDSPLKALSKVFWDQMDTVTHSAANECPVPPVCVTFWVIHRPSIQVTFVTMCVNAGQLLASWFASLSRPSQMFQNAHCSRVSFEFISIESWRAAWFIVNRKNCHCKDTMGHRSMHCHLSRFSSIWIWLWLKMAKRNVEPPSIYSERMKRTTWREAKIYRIVISWQIKWIYANGRSFFFHHLSSTFLRFSSVHWSNVCHNFRNLNRNLAPSCIRPIVPWHFSAYQRSTSAFDGETWWPVWFYMPFILMNLNLTRATWPNEWVGRKLTMTAGDPVADLIHLRPYVNSDQVGLKRP